VLRAATGVARRGGVLGPRTLDRLAAAGVPDPVEWTDEVRGAFLDLLDAGPGAVDALETLDGLGLLERYLPAWTAVRCRPQRDPYHRSTVDVHLLSTLAAASELLARPDEPVAEAAVGLVEDRRALLLGALLHDIGKTGGGGHVPVGLAIAAETLDRMGVAEPAAGLVRFLVAEHLLLSDTATRRDLEDEEQILDVAARVGDEARLAALYLLTRADAEATGPLAWTPWRAALVRELVGKVQRALERGAVGPGVGERLVERTDEIRRLLASRDALDVERVLDRKPRADLLNVPPERVARHFGLLRPPPGRLDVRTLEEPGDRPNTYSLTVVAADRPGLLAQIAGALSLSGLSILTAQVFTTEAGEAVDVFEVEGAFEPNVTEERWRRFRSTLRRALDGRLSLDHGVRERRAQYPPPRLDLPVDVVAHTDASDFFTVVEVGAPDRIGLLFDITTAFTEVGLDVHLAKVATYGGRVVDAFYVRDELGRKVEDPARIADLERVLKERLGAGEEGER
jgi:[protein-PII] uridylyltransferase